MSAPTAPISVELAPAGEAEHGVLAKPLLLGLALAAMSIAVYVPSFHAGRIWDDDDLVFASRLNHLPNGLRRIWLSTQPYDFFPLTYSDWWIEYRIWGDGTLPFHVGNVLLHAVNVILFWRVLRRLKIPAAWWAAALFAVHPANVATVAWIAERKNLLAMFFLLLCALAWLHDQRRPAMATYVLALACFCLSLLAKTSAVMFPFVLVLFAWWLHGRVTRRDIVRSIPFFAISLVLGLITVWFQNHRVIGNENQPTFEPLVDRLLAAGRVFWFYPAKTLVPVHLSALYPRWTIDRSNPMAYLSDAAFVIVGAILITFRNRLRGLFFAFVFVALMVFPISGILKMAFSTFSRVSDHYQYFPTIATIALVCAGVHLLSRWITTAMAGTLGCAALIALSLLTWRHQAVFHDAITFWQSTVRESPNNAQRWTDLAHAYFQAGNIVESDRSYEKSFALDPASMAHRSTYAGDLLKQGRIKECMQQLDIVLQHQPTADNLCTYGNLLLVQGHPQQAMGQFERALKINPKSAPAERGLCTACAAIGHTEQAIHHARQAVALDPDSKESLNNLAWVLATQIFSEFRSPAEAVAAAEKACSLTDYQEPGYLDTLAAAYADAGRFSDAISTADRAMQLAKSQKNTALQADIQKHLDCYKANKPFREDLPGMK